ncbi:MAG: hypothetical protein MJB14_02745 [Spirochaetes bacterium]|nr:hypothetical protein [Spirochaetota bacterium]
MLENGAIFEIIMLVCFGVSWPISIYKTWKSKTVKGATPVFYILIFIGYLSGAVYKYFFNMDKVIFLYIFNSITVGIQIILYFYTYHKEINTEPPQWL